MANVVIFDKNIKWLNLHKTVKKLFMSNGAGANGYPYKQISTMKTKSDNKKQMNLNPSFIAVFKKYFKINHSPKYKR